MKILYDLSATQPVSVNDFHGGGEYAKTVFHRICETLPSNLTLEVFYDPLKPIENSILEICKVKGFTINICKNNGDISRLLGDRKYDVFYTALPYSYSDLIIPQETKFIYTVHGLRALEYPADKYELKYRKSNLKIRIKHFIFLIFPCFWIKYKIKKGVDNLNKFFSITDNQTIITISNHSKYSIAYFFPRIDISQIKTFYPPIKNYNFNNSKDDNILKSLSLTQNKYILLICGDRFEKGAYCACRILYSLMKKQKRFPDDIKVLILGISYNKQYHKLTDNCNRFIFHNYVSTEDLEILYKNAHLFLFPTLNEGFGIPPLEAMKYGTVCACSANSAITEIYGDSVLYFNPFDETELGIRILQSFDENIRNEKKQKLSIRYQQIRERQEKDLDLLVNTIINHP